MLELPYNLVELIFRWIKPPPRQIEGPLENENIALLVRLAGFCAASYRWNARTFEVAMAKEKVTTFEPFRRRQGPPGWRLPPLVYMPFSVVLLLFSYATILLLTLALLNVIWGMGRGSVAELAGPDVWPPIRWVWLQMVSIGTSTTQIWSSAVASAISLVDVLRSDLAAVMDRLPAFLVSFLVALVDVVAWLWSRCLEIVSPVLFWNPPFVDDWLARYAAEWIQLFLVELRFVVGFAFLLGSVLAIVLLLVPSSASGRAYGMVHSGDNTVTVVFCGSVFLDNFLINACVWRYTGPLRHFGFHRAWAHLKPHLEPWIAANLPAGGEVILAGHSLGGALAEIAAFDLADRFKIKLVAAFGSSRIGDSAMRVDYSNRLDQAHRPLQDRTWHITHSDDIIPRLPPAWFFKHVGEGYLLSSDGDLRKGTKRTIFQEHFALVNLRIFVPMVALKVWPTIVLIYICSLPAYYIFIIGKGLAWDHYAGYYRDALKERASALASVRAEPASAPEKPINQLDAELHPKTPSA